MENGIPVRRKVMVPDWFVWSTTQVGDDFWLELDDPVLAPIPRRPPYTWIYGDLLDDIYEADRTSSEESSGVATDESIGFPHLYFCEATDSIKLIEFITAFGPVLGQLQGKGKKPGTRLFLQNISVLTAQQALFAAVQRLLCSVNELDELSQLVATDKIAVEDSERLVRDTATMLERQKLKELRPAMQEVRKAIHSAVQESEVRGLEDSFRLIVSSLDQPATAKEKLDNLTTSHQLLCAIFNLFPPGLHYAAGAVQECPTTNNTGIRPFLYFMLREMYLSKYRLWLCKRPDCGRFFIPTRGNTSYCSKECGNVVRQRASNSR